MLQNLSEGDQFEAQMGLLQEVLDKKREALEAVLAISENQELLYNSPPSDTRREFLLEMGKEKQRRIDDIITCDMVFQRIFDEIGADFEANSKNHREKAKKIQASINEVMELDVKIRAQEQKIGARVKESFGLQGGPAAVKGKENTVKTVAASYIINQYKNNNKPSADA